MSSNAFRLITLGRLALLSPSGVEDAELGKRRRKLALLAVLARAGRPLERDYLIEMFWGDQDEERARHSLSDALSHLRRVLGPDSITARRTNVSLGGGAKLRVDALELERAAAAKDARRVTELYGGPFLDFIHVDGSASFEQWVSREREHFHSLFVRAAASHCLALARAREWDACAALATRWLDAVPLSSDAALQLLHALEAPGTRDANARALAAFRQLESRLDREYEATPDRDVERLAAVIAARLAGGPAPVHDAATGAPAGSEIQRMEAARTEMPRAETPRTETSAAPPQTAASPTRHGKRRIAIWGSLAAMVVGVAATLGSFALRGDEMRPSSRPAIAIIAIRNLTGDSSTSWLSAGLPQMIVADLSRSSAVDVVDPSRVEQV
ncbi:MAG TPA: BTAD domain-containing putative transcriptional regulator, partial [Gemmatimonadaceae bacterium]|nr:BTAD domain-containing putative transcriptional regulator [Gemmatimonadaceae bacterium]